MQGVVRAVGRLTILYAIAQRLLFELWYRAFEDADEVVDGDGGVAAPSL